MPCSMDCGHTAHQRRLQRDAGTLPREWQACCSASPLASSWRFCSSGPAARVSLSVLGPPGHRYVRISATPLSTVTTAHAQLAAARSTCAVLHCLSTVTATYAHQAADPSDVAPVNAGAPLEISKRHAMPVLLCIRLGNLCSELVFTGGCTSAGHQNDRLACTHSMVPKHLRLSLGGPCPSWGNLGST